MPDRNRRRVQLLSLSAGILAGIVGYELARILFGWGDPAETWRDRAPSILLVIAAVIAGAYCFRKTAKHA